MDCILLLFERIAAAPIIAAPMMNMVMAVAATTETGTSVIDAATKRNEKLFVMYIIILVVTAVVIALFTWLVWDSDKKLQDAIRSDADTRINEAKRNEKNLENENLKLRSDLETEKAKVAELQKDALDAKAQQQKVEMELEKQRERAASAERSLLELQEQLRDRRLSKDQKEKLRAYLAQFPPQSVRVLVFVGTNDGIPFSLDFMEAIDKAGWKAEHGGQATMGGTLKGVVLLMKDVNHAPKSADILREALKEIGIDASGVDSPSLEEGQVTLFIAPKAL